MLKKIHRYDSPDDDVLLVRERDGVLLLDVFDSDGEGASIAMRVDAVDALVQSLAAVVATKGGESGASVPAPAVPMEGEPGPGVQLGPARASIARWDGDGDPPHADEVITTGAALRDLQGAHDVWRARALRAESALDVAHVKIRELKGSDWIPPNASDTHAPAPGPIGQATLAGYPEPWEDDVNGR